MDALLTTEDVAEFFRLDVVTIRRMINKGELTAYRVGGEYRFRKVDIDQYLDRQRVSVDKEARGHLGKLTQRARKLVSAAPLSGAFDHFTGRARNVLTLAQEEARAFHHSYVGTEHLLLGVLRERKGVGAMLLLAAGCELDEMRNAVRDRVGVGAEGEIAPGEVPLTGRLKKALELAVDEAKGLNHSYVGTEHLVLGLLSESHGVGGQILRERGIELSSARNGVLAILTTHK